MTGLAEGKVFEYTCPKCGKKYTMWQHVSEPFITDPVVKELNCIYCNPNMG